MIELGYALSSEEFSPADLISFAQTAEAVGFDFAMISDHFHPWTESQPHSPFAWTVIGAISQAIKRLSLGTGVTCPSMRYSPALIAQAAATASVMMPGRFILGLGSGENLNEHITGNCIGRPPLSGSTCWRKRLARYERYGGEAGKATSGNISQSKRLKSSRCQPGCRQSWSPRRSRERPGSLARCRWLDLHRTQG